MQVLPDSWLESWQTPPAADRPLQIVHGWFGDRTTPEKLLYFKEECGLGGLVVNVHANNYLRNEPEWDRLVDVVRSAKQIGLRIWLYDEDGYPSLMAGGLVLENHPELESLALVYDASKMGEDAFSVRPAYEHTHASNKYATLRRYPNPLNPATTTRFIDVTHNEYKKRLGTLHEYVEAYFTDEPSLNAVNIGTISEEVQKKLRIVDPVDPMVSPLPMVAWSETLQAELDKDALPLNRASLFTGDSEPDRAMRQRFWETVARLNTDSYYRTIRDWCRDNAVASSGHTLHEENILAHVPLDGNKLTVLRMMDIPGLDQLSSDPRVFARGGWKAAGFPASAAYLNGTRLLFTEVSDFVQKMGGEKKPADLARMQATAAWQAAWGASEFTLYYVIADRDPATYRAYCEYVGRLNAILRQAQPVPLVLLYYPITEIQREYRPTALSLDLSKQSVRLQETIRSFDRIGQMLVQHQIPFLIVDDQALRDLAQSDPKKDWRVLVPCHATIPKDLENARLSQAVDQVDKSLASAELAPFAHEYLDPPAPWIAYGKFRRDGHSIYLLVNTDEKPYQGKFIAPKDNFFALLKPESGEMNMISTPDTSIEIILAPYQAVLVVGQ